MEDELNNERIFFKINNNTLLKTLLMGGIGLLLTGMLCYNFSKDYITIGLSLIIGITISILGLYFLLISQPLIYKITETYEKDEEDEELEFQSIMKIE